MAAFTRNLTDTPELDRIRGQKLNRPGASGCDPLIAATIDYEVAQDDYAAIEFGFAQAETQLSPILRRAATKARGEALQAQIDTGVRFWIEADAAGLVNLFDKVEGVSEAVKAEILAVRLAEIERIAGRARGALSRLPIEGRTREAVDMA